MRSTFILVVLALGGCANMRPAAYTEAAWQTLNIIDAGQTITIARNPSRFAEGDPVTGQLTGPHPQERQVYATMAAYAIIHAGVTYWLDSEDSGHGAWHVASIAWQTLSLGDKGFAVGHNFSQGDGMWGAHQAPQFCGMKECR